MKIFFISLILCTCLYGKAQPSSGINDTCSALQSLAGTWQYVNGSDTIKIYLKKHRARYNNPIQIFDVLWGYLEYKHGTNIIVTDYANRFNTIPTAIDNIDLANKTITLKYLDCNYSGTNILKGKLRYRLSGDQLYYVTVIVNSTGTQMLWHQEFARTDLMDNSIPWNPPTGTNAMPGDFLLIKQ